MGLLDALFPASDGGGLLDFLKNNASAAVANYPGGLPSDRANYGNPAGSPAPAMPSAAAAMGAPAQANAAMPQAAPQNAPAPAPAPPMAMQAPSAAQSAPPALGIGDRFGAAGRGIVANVQGGPLGMLFGGIAGLAGMGQGTPLQQKARIENITGRALLAKGVDSNLVQAAIAQATAGNNGPLKTLWDQKFGPNNYKVVQIGQDMMGGRQFGLLNPSATSPGAAITPIKGAGGGSATSNNPLLLSDDTKKAMAAQYLAGDHTVLQNMGRSKWGAMNMMALRNEIYRQAKARGMDANAIVNRFNEQAGALSGQRTVGTRAANISLAANEANNMIPIALAASAKLPRSQWVPWNKMVQEVQYHTSSPELASFVAATNSLVNSYVRAVSPGGVPTDAMREHAYTMLNSAQSPQAYAAVIKTMQQEMQSALNAPGQVKKELRGEAPPMTTAPAASASPATGTFPDGATATNPQTGQKIIFKGGKWQPQ